MKIPPFHLERFFARYEFDVPYLLCASDCESVSIQDLLALEPEAEAQLKQLWLGYTESTGHPDLRRAIAHLYQTIAPDQILVHAGAEEAIFIFMNVALERGDHVIVHDPCYQSLRDIAAALGCEVTKWTAQEQQGWALDVEWLARQITPRTKAIVLNCPHNPTGYLMQPDTFTQVLDLAREHRLWLFSDEVYRGLEYDEADRLPAACDCYDRAISLGVMSKTYGLAGLRVGWVATKSQEILQPMAELKDYTTICTSAPSEFLATLALRHHVQLAQRNRDIVRGNLALLQRFFMTYQQLFEWIPPKAGPIAFPRLKIERDSEAFCLDLAQKEGVLLLPGNYYDFGNRHFRIGFGRKNMLQALARFEDYLSRYVS
ncbi:aminotransferase class I/II-fold pyridoxal phosphate-dependent enzyme [candidate division KSB3 bacterium]|uniref:Aminotransferase class I/II-fold pyridoxal phosphate-dependent enzyme n=1 Tax=candidate division KSB3 bacterium TaxID=2044937 RepID=A0A9D5JUX7_9BACT|nr:aminotransferase class I/II-fold pyridoxal phosphate-dependent enzyme [candidate division KSB3 bacterium]MBD3324116.1 aminotransferase class I/II-fold pyridoxal phosphate-dependent enzyme [candidate division KSB3 bacterium]